jgi:hypothetical protein
VQARGAEAFLKVKGSQVCLETKRAEIMALPKRRVAQHIMEEESEKLLPNMLPAFATRAILRLSSRESSTP